MFNKIKTFYMMKLYTAEHVYQFYINNKISREQYVEIVGTEPPEAS